MRRFATVVCLSGLAAGRAFAGTPSTAGAALVDKFLACYAAEGGVVTPDDKAALDAAAGDLARSIGSDADVQRLVSSDCAQVAQQLGGSGPLNETPKLPEVRPCRC